MTLQEYAERIRNLSYVTATRVVSSVIEPAGNELLATVKNRIVQSGKNSSGQNIGNYSTKSAYFTKPQFDRGSSFKLRGKNSNSPDIGNRERKSMYMPNGYKELRDIQGKPTDNIKANYTGSTMASYQQEVTDKGVLQGMINEQSSKVRKGLEKQKKQDIYKPTPIEIQEYKKNVLLEMGKLNEKILKGVSV